MLKDTIFFNNSRTRIVFLRTNTVMRLETIPSSHFSPCHPGLQTHVYLACPSMQSLYPSLWHGRGLHWFEISVGWKTLETVVIWGYFSSRISLVFLLLFPQVPFTFHETGKALMHNIKYPTTIVLLIQLARICK